MRVFGSHNETKHS